MESQLLQPRGERRPRHLHFRHAVAGHREPGAEALQTRAFVVLQFVEFEEAGFLGGGGHHLQLAAVVGEHDPGGGGAEQFDAAGGQGVQEVDDVEVGDQGVGQFHEGGGDELFSACHVSRRVALSSKCSLRLTTSAATSVIDCPVW